MPLYPMMPPIGSVVQVLNSPTNAVATGTTILPWDDTIPQNTEGDQYMSLTITPKSSTNTLIIQSIFFGSHTGLSEMSIALFQDSTANAIAATSSTIPTGGYRTTLVLNHIMAAGTTSATTFKLRAGGNSAGTTTFNGAGSGRIFGAITKSSMVIWEISA